MNADIISVMTKLLPSTGFDWCRACCSHLRKYTEYLDDTWVRLALYPGIWHFIYSSYAHSNGRMAWYHL